MRSTKVFGPLLIACALAGGGVAAGCGDRTAETPAPTGTRAAAETPLAEMTVADVAGRIARSERIAVVDVNGPDKYAAGHVPGAINMQSRQIDAARLPTDRATPLVFYCWDEH